MRRMYLAQSSERELDCDALDDDEHLHKRRKVAISENVTLRRYKRHLLLNLEEGKNSSQSESHRDLDNSLNGQNGQEVVGELLSLTRSPGSSPIPPFAQSHSRVEKC